MTYYKNKGLGASYLKNYKIWTKFLGCPIAKTVTKSSL